MTEYRNEQISSIGKRHSKLQDIQINYGTAGFRDRAVLLDHVMFRMGLLSTLRSKSKKATIGVMITASHNPEEDNGVKLIDPLGEMLEMSWEKYATRLANVSDDDIPTVLNEIITAEGIDMSTKANVLVARDTRPSSVSLSQAVADGLTATDAQTTDYGLLTTPQLHYIVRCVNTNNEYGQPTLKGYYEKLSQAFLKLYRKNEPTGRNHHVCIDGANGVGAVQLMQLAPYIDSVLDLSIVNDGKSGKLNHMCGADYVKTQQKAPEGITMKEGVHYCSFDGDADRIVYYYQTKSGNFQLLDGDKIATLIAMHLQKLIKHTGLSLNLGIVQTAYANGSSTDYITKTLNIPVACTPTGVKHLHHRALDFDIGVYFEANGHGTVLFSENAQQVMKTAQSSDSCTELQKQSVDELFSTIDVINQTVGDAISDMLLVELILFKQGWSMEEWNNQYTDLPNRQLKIKVKDRRVIQTTDAERQVTSPPNLQANIDQLVAKITNGRSFVRPSGTEDVVRVYAEANTQANTDLLGYEVSCAVYELAGGVGDKPAPP